MKNMRHLSINVTSFFFSDETAKPVVSFRYQAPARPVPPPGVDDFDLENWKDPLQCSEYAMEIFQYYKTREVSLNSGHLHLYCRINAPGEQPADLSIFNEYCHQAL